MMKQSAERSRKNAFAIIIIAVLVCVVMAFIDAVFKADYFVKSAIKIVIFLAIPAVYLYFDKGLSLRDLFRIRKKGIILSLLLGTIVYFFILGAYFVIGPYFDLSGITRSLTGNIGVTAGNFVYVSIYISFVNSLLEEFFFRGFSFLMLKKYISRKWAYTFSAGIFALYHVAIMAEWVSVPLTALLILSLFAGGIIFNKLNEKYENIYPSWMVHMFANFAINTIGMILFGIL